MQDIENVDLTRLIVDLGTVQIYTTTVKDLIDQACIEFHIDDLLKLDRDNGKLLCSMLVCIYSRIHRY